MKLLILLLFVVSCGKDVDKRCFTRDEVINYCAAKEMGETGVTLDIAKNFCSSSYPYESCYAL